MEVKADQTADINYNARILVRAVEFLIRCSIADFEESLAKKQLGTAHHSPAFVFIPNTKRSILQMLAHKDFKEDNLVQALSEMTVHQRLFFLQISSSRTKALHYVVKNFGIDSAILARQTFSLSQWSEWQDKQSLMLPLVKMHDPSDPDIYRNLWVEALHPIGDKTPLVWDIRDANKLRIILSDLSNEQIDYLFDPYASNKFLREKLYKGRDPLAGINQNLELKAVYDQTRKSATEIPKPRGFLF